MLWIMVVGSVAGFLPLPQRADRSAPESTTVVLSPELARPGDTAGHRDRGWRRLWSDTLTLPIVHARDIDGGLVRLDAESGVAGNAVIAWGADSHAYRVTPVARDPVSASLPSQLQGSSLEPLLQGVAVTVHPTASLVASALYRMVGLAAVQPMIGVLRVSVPVPGMLRALNNEPVWIERAPELDRKPYEDLRLVITTNAFLARQSGDPTLGVARREYLAARLLDLVMGDRDRRPEHWLWGLRASPSGDEWVPIATHQEEAFLRAEGWSRLVLNQYEPGYQVFGPEAFDVEDLAATAYDLDRRLLAPLDRPVWDSVASALRRALSDSVISAAVAHLPPPHRLASQATIVNGLEGRRALLHRIADQLYRLIATYPDIELSDASEYVTLRRESAGDLELRVTANGQEALHRVFRPDETKELRLHLDGGADTVRLEGSDRHGIGVRLTSVRGTVAVIGDAPSGKRIVLYAARDSVSLDPPGAVRVVPRARGRWQRWPAPLAPPLPPDWGVKRSPILHFNLNGDLGLLVGAGVQWTWRGFDQRYFRQRLTASVDYASAPASGRVEVAFERRDLLRNLHLSAGVRLSGIEVVRFFGYGNNTPFTQDVEFYRTDARELSLRTAVVLSSRPSFEFSLGPVLSFGRMDTTGAGTQVAIDRPYGTGRFTYAGLEASVTYAPATALAQLVNFSVTGNAMIVPNWFDVDRGSFSSLGGELRGLWMASPLSRFALATRLGGTILQGTVPLRQATRVGGSNTLRGWDTDRFTGDRASAYGSLEARVRAFRLRVNFISADLGVLAFGDAGRVWTSGEQSSTVHTGFGGGIWLAPTLGVLPGIENIIARLDIAFSRERTVVSVGTGFRF